MIELGGCLLTANTHFPAAIIIIPARTVRQSVRPPASRPPPAPTQPPCLLSTLVHYAGVRADDVVESTGLYPDFLPTASCLLVLKLPTHFIFKSHLCFTSENWVDFCLTMYVCTSIKNRLEKS